jgi:MFS superfamily sulfate permease-like transporter
MADSPPSDPTPERGRIERPARLTAGAGWTRWIDVTAADAVCELDDTLHSAGIELCFAEMKDPVKDKLRRFELSRASARRPFSQPSAKP